MNSLVRYKQVVQNSQLLNSYEKQSMLEGAEEFPEDFLINIVAILQGFDERTRERQKEYLGKVKQAFSKYVSTIENIKGLSDEKRAAYLAKAGTLYQAILSRVNSS